MTSRTMMYVYDHIDYPAQITFSVEGDFDSNDYGNWDDLAENMLVSLFNDQVTKWHLNTCEEYIND